MKKLPDPILTRGQKAALTRAWNKHWKLQDITSYRQLELLYAKFWFNYMVAHKYFPKEELDAIEADRMKRVMGLEKAIYEGSVDVKGFARSFSQQLYGK